MGLAVRVIPTLLAKGTRLVKGKRFSADRIVGHVQQAARVHQARGVDELIILDVEATKKGRGPDFRSIEELTAECFMPLTVGGGVRSVEDAVNLLAAGADKVAVGVAAIYTGSDTYDAVKKGLIPKLAKSLGCQAVVAALDVCGGYVTHQIGGCALVPVYAAHEFADAGAGEILLTSVDREGTMIGYDIKLIKDVCAMTGVPVIAHGGCSGPEDMLKAIEAGASAVAAGALFQFTEWTPKSCAQWLAEKGVEVRV